MAWFGNRHSFLLLLLGGGAAGAGCRSAVPLHAIPSAMRFSADVPHGRVQSSDLYRKAKLACRGKQYHHAAALLGRLALTPGLSPVEIAYCQQQRDICLRDAGVTPTTSVIAPLHARNASAVTPLQAHVGVSALPESADCGPRALLLVCKQLGVRTALPALRKAAGTTAQGTSMAGLAYAAQTVGLKAEGVQVSREALAGLDSPAVAWTHGNHFIAVLSVAGRGEDATACIHDPNQAQEETLAQERLLQASSGMMLLLHR